MLLQSENRHDVGWDEVKWDEMGWHGIWWDGMKWVDLYWNCWEWGNVMTRKDAVSQPRTKASEKCCLQTLLSETVAINTHALSRLSLLFSRLSIFHLPPPPCRGATWNKTYLYFLSLNTCWFGWNKYIFHKCGLLAALLNYQKTCVYIYIFTYHHNNINNNDNNK